MQKKLNLKCSKQTIRLKKISLLTFSTIIMLTSNAYAATPQIVTGAMNLARDAGLWALGLIPVAAGAAIGYQALQKILHPDPAEVGHRNKMMVTILKAAVIGEGSAGIITALLAYFAG